MLQRDIVEILCREYEKSPNGHAHEFEFENASCEQIAAVVWKALENSEIWCRAVEVWEDNENGARLEAE